MKSATTYLTIIFNNVSHKAMIFIASFLYLIFAANNAFAATNTYTSNGTFTVPVGVNQLTVSISGGGGGGGALSNSGAGQDGGTTTFGTLLTAFGGHGGQNGSADIGGGIGGAMGGVGGQNGSNGGVVGYGGNGGSSLFGTAGTKNTNMFYRTSNQNATGYGAGGAGGFDGGGAGGAQAYSNVVLSVTPGQIIPITIGQGGAGSMGDGAMATGGDGSSGFVSVSYTLDTTAPVITLNGTSTIAIPVGTTYADAGATAWDNIDGNITSQIITTGSVNTSVIGTYTMSYSVSDSSGNAATPVTRTVNVVDTIAPVITLNGANPQTIQFGSSYVELGATVTDNYDTGLTANIDATSVNTGVAGTYTVTYNASDSSGNSATTVTRTVIVAPADNIAPTDPIASSSTHTAGTVSSVTTGTFNWTSSTDAGGSGLAGYSFVLDTNPTTIPDNVVDAVTSNSATFTLSLGTTYYFHIKAIDGAGNTSQTSHIGPFAISDSQVTITNSTIGGNFYALFSPSIASSTAFGITGSSTIANATITAPFNLSDVTLNTVTLTNATLAQTTATNSTITNADLTSCTITNSLVKNYYAVGCSVTNSLVDPVNGLNNLTGTTVSGGSKIYYSDVTYSTITSSYIATSTISYSTLTNATSTNSTIATSTISGGTIDLSSVASSTLSNATVSSSTLTNTTVLGTGSTITNSTITGLTVTDAVINNDIISSGTITLSNGTSIVITTPTALSTLVNAAPSASFLGAATGILQATFTDTSTDANSGTAFPDSWTYSWDFGDGSIATSSVAVIGNNQTHTYATVGTYTVTLTVTDQYGLSSTATNSVTVTATTPSTFNIVATAGLNGAITPTGTTTVAQGANQTFTITPNAGFDVASLSVDGTSTATSTTYTFSNVQADHTIDATFATSTTPDTTAPVITILGLNPVSVVAGSTYVDAGATALDNIDGNVTANIVATSTVDTTTTGTYNVSYSVSDSAGNIATSTRKVNVLATADTIPPVVTLNGVSPVNVVVNTSYTDAGATAVDNVDGDITASMITTNPVDITTIGVYTVGYSSTDSSGNTATSTRTVNVVATPVADTIPPSTPVITGITTTATTTLSSTLTAVWTDATDNSGALAGYSFVWDTNASTIPDAIAEGQATTTTATLPNGTWYFHVVAVDPSLNISNPAATFGPIVINNAPAGDTTNPVGPTAVTSSTNTVGVTASSTAVSLAWDTATDNVGLAGYSYVWDSNASTSPDNVAETSVTSLSTNLPNGTWYFHIRSTDTSGNVSSPVVDFGPIIIATTTTDVIAPVGPTAVTSSTHNVGVASSNQSVNVSWDTATDDVALAGYSYVWDTATSTTPDAIADTTNTNTTTILPNGTWYFHVVSVDTAGNISGPVVNFGPVIINTNLPSDQTPPSAPVATVATSSATTLNASWTASTDNSGALAGYSFVWDTNPTTVPDNITETQSTSTQTTVSDGLWYFHVVAVDPSLNISTPATHVGPVKVDTTAPVLTLNGASVVPVVVGTSYTDQGATALDNIDGDITSRISATSTVDINTLGTYMVTYSVSDLTGNAATPITRTIHVIPIPDIIPPVITITGATSTSIVQGNSYVDLGATATDNVDGNITANIVTTNLVNTNVVGTYTVNYTVQDSSGNIASASRTVNVIAPVYFNLSASATGNGTISPNGTMSILQGNNQTYTITPNYGHDISSLLIDGVSVATTTSYTLSNVQADHTIDVTFAQNPSAPFFNIIATAGLHGTISSMGTTTIQQGNNQTYTITPDAGYDITSLTVDGVATTTSSTFTFSNINADHTIDATFADLVSPVGPTAVTSSSHSVSTISSNQNVSVSWDTATDNVALAGYSYAWDANPATSPDAVVDTVTPNATSTLPNGTWYFHVVSVDTSGNVSTPTINFGPIIISDSQVLISNSTIGGTVYGLYSPSIASSTALGITGTSTLTNSALFSPWNLNNVTVATSTLTGVTASNSTILSSTLTNATSTGSTITGSTIANAILTNATLNSVTINGTSSAITNSTLTNTTVTNAVINNNIMSSGTIVLPNGTPMVVSTSTPLTSLMNYAPAASFTTSVSNLAVSITDTTSDPNVPALPDTWVYNWNFGDGATLTTTTTTLGSNQSHTYASAGNYTISLTVTDLNGSGLSSTYTSNVSVAPAPVAVSGGGGGGGGGSWYAPVVKLIGDFTGDGLVNLNDFGIMMMQWGMKGLSLISDINNDKVVDIIDFNQLLVNWTNK